MYMLRGGVSVSGLWCVKLFAFETPAIVHSAVSGEVESGRYDADVARFQSYLVEVEVVALLEIEVPRHPIVFIRARGFCRDEVIAPTAFGLAAHFDAFDNRYCRGVYVKAHVFREPVVDDVLKYFFEKR